MCFVERVWWEFDFKNIKTGPVSESDSGAFCIKLDEKLDPGRLADIVLTNLFGG